MKLSFNPLYIIIFGLSLTLVTGVIAYDRLNFLPAKAVYEPLIILASLLSIFRVKNRFLFFSFLSISYVFVSYVSTIYVYGDFNFFDFFISYKSFFYVILLTPFVGKKYLTRSVFDKFLVFLILCFVFKYLVSRFIFDNSRPGLLDENNFELLFVLLMYLLSCFIDKRVFTLKLLAIVLIVFVSGSRSGILSLLFLIFMAYDKKLSSRGFFALVIFFFLSAMSIIVLMQRLGGGIESIDRFVFLQLFIHDVSSWSLLDYFFGNIPLTPMSFYTCNSLSFFQTLFSHKNDGTCYSVVLHSYILRMIFDHGILGLIFVFSFVYTALRTSGYNIRFCITVVGLISINGLSVSAFNSVFCFLGLLFLLVFDKDSGVTMIEKPNKIRRI